jgi:hypothetical protein
MAVYFRGANNVGVTKKYETKCRLDEITRPPTCVHVTGSFFFVCQGYKQSTYYMRSPDAMRVVTRGLNTSVEL